MVLSEEDKEKEALRPMVQKDPEEALRIAKAEADEAQSKLDELTK